MSPGEAQEYLEKIFQLTVPLPRKRTADLRGFLESNLALIGVKLQNEGLSSAIVERFGRNLRNLKLFINWFSFQRQLIGEIANLDEEALFRWLYLDSTMARSMNTSLKGGSPNLVLALEFLSHGGFMHDAELRARYVAQLNSSKRNYTALIVYSIISAQNEVELPATNLDTGQMAMLEALKADGEVSETLKVMREGNKLLLDSDLREMIYQASSKDIDIVSGDGAPDASDRRARRSSSVTVSKKAGKEGILDWGNPFSAQDWNQLGDKLLAVARLPDAYLCYLLATLMDPEWAAYVCDLARVFARAGHLDAAKSLLAEGFEKEPTSPYVLVELAYFYDILLVEEDLGSLLYRKALENNSTNPSTPYYLAMNLHKEERYKDAYLACLDANLKDLDSETKRTRLSQYAVDAGAGSGVGQRTNEELAAELVAAIEAGTYPLHLSDAEERSLWERVTERPDAEKVAAQLSRPPF
jgi:tetratricopeptide (TPR) repeat protein